MFVLTIISFIVTPIIRAKLNHQFMLGARNQAFLTEYVSGMETVKSLQMEPQLKQTFGNYLTACKVDGYKMNQTHKMSLRGGGLGHWLVGHVFRCLSVARINFCRALIAQRIAPNERLSCGGLRKLIRPTRAK